MQVMKSPLLQHLLRSNSSAKLLISSFLQNERRDETIGWATAIRRITSAEFDGDMFKDDVKATEKHNSYQLKESRLSFPPFIRNRRPSVVSTGSLKLDFALGIGGLPKGRMVEIYGYEASGKTTLGLHIIKEAQKVGGYCAYLDVENAMDPSLLESMGVNKENLLMVGPDSAENLLSVVDTLAKSGSVDVIVVDTVAALVPQREIDLKIGDIRRESLSQIMTEALQRIQSSLLRSETLIVFINQVRFNPEQGQCFRDYGEYTCAGYALGFSAAVRLKLSRRKLLLADDEAIGLQVCVQVVKNELAPAMNEAEMYILFGKGISRAHDAIDLASEHGLIMDQEGRYEIRGEVFSSKDEAIQYLSENEAILDELVMSLRRVVIEKEDRVQHYSRALAAIDLACEHRLIMNQPGRYTIRGEVFSSKEEAIQYLSENEAILDKLVMILRRLVLAKEDKVQAARKKAMDIKLRKNISLATEAIDLACEHGLILDQRGIYEIRGKVFNSKDEAIQYLSKNEAILNKLVMILRRVVLGKEDSVQAAMEKAEKDIKLRKDISRASEAIDLACEYGVLIIDQGGRYEIRGKVCNSKEEAIQYLSENESILDKLVTILTRVVLEKEDKGQAAMKKAEMDIKVGKGISRASAAIDLACEHGLIRDQGGRYEIRGKVFNNKEEAIQYLSENEAILDKLVTVLRRHD